MPTNLKDPPPEHQAEARDQATGDTRASIHVNAARDAIRDYLVGKISNLPAGHTSLLNDLFAAVEKVLFHHGIDIDHVVKK